MTSRVDDTKSGREIAAWAVVDRKGSLCAKVQAYYSPRGAVTVNVMNMGDDNGPRFQAAKAGGYGYDKFTSALSGMTVAGVKITDHCGEQKPIPRKGFFAKGAKAPKGFYFANHTLFDTRTKQRAQIDERSENGKALIAGGVVVAGYGNCYRKSGLDILGAFGFRVYQVI